MKNSFLKNKRILITAGPTWVPIDDVRVISNISSGELGVLLAEEARAHGSQVDLFLGPVGRVCSREHFRITRFRYFNEFLDLVQRELKKRKYDIILHGAAVSDYLVKRFEGKISSKRYDLSLKLSRAPKIIDIIRRLNPEAFLVMFKLEVGVTDSVLLKRALEAMKRSGADLAVANTFDDGKYKGFIVGSNQLLAKTRSKPQLASALLKILKEKVEVR